MLRIAGSRFGRLVVVSVCGQSKSKNLIWLCKCDCGRFSRPVGSRLINGGTKSCGCLARENTSIRSKLLNTKHGDNIRGKIASEYVSWAAMKQRCSNPHNVHYKHYGGRGISVCARWADYPSFLEDMGRKPNPTFTIDRINVDGDYEPSNCRWLSRAENNHTKRRQND